MIWFGFLYSAWTWYRFWEHNSCMEMKKNSLLEKVNYMRKEKEPWVEFKTTVHGGPLELNLCGESRWVTAPCVRPVSWGSCPRVWIIVGVLCQHFTHPTCREITIFCWFWAFISNEGVWGSGSQRAYITTETRGCMDGITDQQFHIRDTDCLQIESTEGHLPSGKLWVHTFKQGCCD